MPDPNGSDIEFVIRKGKTGIYKEYLKSLKLKYPPADMPVPAAGINGSSLPVWSTSNRQLFDELFEVGYIADKATYIDIIAAKKQEKDDSPTRSTLEDATAGLEAFVEYFCDDETGTLWIRDGDNRCFNFKSYIDVVISQYFETINESTGGYGIDLRNRMQVRAMKNPKTLNARYAIINNTLYYQLNKDKCVVVTCSGWEIEDISKLNVNFRAHASFGDQVTPIHTDKDIFDFMDLFRCGSNEQEILLAGAIIAGFVAKIDHPIINIVQGQGRGKTTIADRIKGVIDPLSSHRNVMQKPSDVDDLILSLYHNQCLIIDNVSYLSDKMSDVLSGAVSGAGIPRRALYTDSDIINIPVRPTVIITGVNDNVRLSDLNARTVSIGIKFSPDQHLTEHHLALEFENDLPELLGTVFDVLCDYLKYRDKIPLLDGYRLNDYYIICVIVARLLGVESNTIDAILHEEGEDKTLDNINNSIVGIYILHTIVSCGGYITYPFNGEDMTFTDLMQDMRSSGFRNYTAPNGVSRGYNTIEKDLERVGVFKIVTNASQRKFYIEYDPARAIIDIKPKDIVDDICDVEAAPDGEIDYWD